MSQKAWRAPPLLPFLYGFAPWMSFALDKDPPPHLFLLLDFSCLSMEDVMKRYQIPAFGNWDYCDGVPITQYFDCFAEEKDLFQVPVHVIPAYNIQKVKKEGGRGGGEEKEEKKQVMKKKKKKQSNGGEHRRSRAAPKAVDEDLYKIPPELLYQKPKRKRVARSFWLGCLGMSCIS